MVSELDLIIDRLGLEERASDLSTLTRFSLHRAAWSPSYSRNAHAQKVLVRRAHSRADRTAYFILLRLHEVHGAKNNERHVCGRRRDGEPAVSWKDGPEAH